MEDLQHVIEQNGGQAEFARKIGISRQSLNRIVRGRAKMGPGIALKVYFATGARLGVLEGTGQGK